MFRIYNIIFILLNISSFVSTMKIPIKYSSYKNIRPIFFDIYKQVTFNLNTLIKIEYKIGNIFIHNQTIEEKIFSHLIPS